MDNNLLYLQTEDNDERGIRGTGSLRRQKSADDRKAKFVNSDEDGEIISSGRVDENQGETLFMFSNFF